MMCHYLFWRKQYSKRTRKRNAISNLKQAIRDDRIDYNELQKQ